MRAFSAKAMRIFGYGWIVILALTVIISVTTHIVQSPSKWRGIQDVQWWFSPFNIAGFIVNVGSLVPAIGAFWLAKKLDGHDA